MGLWMRGVVKIGTIGTCALEIGPDHVLHHHLLPPPAPQEPRHPPPPLKCPPVPHTPHMPQPRSGPLVLTGRPHSVIEAPAGDSAILVA